MCRGSKPGFRGPSYGTALVTLYLAAEVLATTSRWGGLPHERGACRTTSEDQFSERGSPAGGREPSPLPFR